MNEIINYKGLLFEYYQQKNANIQLLFEVSCIEQNLDTKLNKWKCILTIPSNNDQYIGYSIGRKKDAEQAASKVAYIATSKIKYQTMTDDQILLPFDLNKTILIYCDVEGVQSTINLIPNDNITIYYFCSQFSHMKEQVQKCISDRKILKITSSPVKDAADHLLTFNIGIEIEKRQKNGTLNDTQFIIISKDIALSSIKYFLDEYNVTCDIYTNTNF